MAKSNTKFVSKVKHLSDRLAGEIREGAFPVGSQLPSINTLSAELGVSRDTVFKAFMELKERGMIGVAPGKGYVVTASVTRVLLLLDEYTPFKHALYTAFSAGLPENHKVDLLFHQYNERLFNLMVRESLGQYDKYVVMNFHPDRLAPVLEEADPEKVLLLDFGDFEKGERAFIAQDFRGAFHTGLQEALPLFRKYRRLNFVIPEACHHPRSGEEVFLAFCAENGFEGEIVRELTPERVRAQEAFLVLTLPDLVTIVKEARARNLVLGEQTGLLAYNEIPPYEVIDKGVTSLSVDFREMGRLAARFVAFNESVRTVLPTNLLVRETL